ncbi:hypothetical protein B0I37DRAFT_300323 [Chaetomium sp. MPI-CAGE-AT-0009]|nr:hypothetical protein B0I37DRAFT_300323 [Chaetomium sp. MPI-CAGE-AT-0009]
MGGLVIKKAYILARQDVLYQSIAKRFHTIYFLATPHRGSDSAQLLNRILSAGGPSHAYVADLERGSLSNQSINDEFRQYSGDVHLWSFYETRKTSVGIFSALIVDRESATLGYREERQTPMDADHRSICKFESPTDPGYRLFCKSFAATIGDIGQLQLQSREKQQRDQLKALEHYLMVPESPENDLIALQDTRAPGTCEWFTSREQFTQWQSFSCDGPTVFWLRGQPGGGKSVLAGHVVDHLQRTSQYCSYFFFKRGDKSKARLSNCLRSLAFQMALADSRILERLLHMRDEDVRIDKSDVRSLWRKLFESDILAVAPSTQCHYWVIDGLDECISDGLALSFLLSKLETAATLRVFITSREVPELESHTQILHINDGRTYLERLLPSDTLADMTTLIRIRVQAWAIRDERDRTALGAKILVKSKGCFLWTALVLNRMALAHGKEQINRVLDEIPHEMEPLYLGTLESMSRISENKDLAKAILTWAACAVRPLTVQELNGALVLEFKDEFPNLKESIVALCGQLVQVDKTGVVHMVHETAREFLLGGKLESEFAIDSTAAHTRLATTCFAVLASKEMKPPRTRRRGPSPTTSSPKPPFVGYACEAFSHHLALSNPNNIDLCHSVHRFLGANVLSWIEVVAQKQDLSPLIRAAKNFEKYLAAAATVRTPLGEKMGIMISWPTDLVRIAARFGDAILAAPSAIHWVVLPFCPIDSAICQAASPGRKLSIAGLHSTQWDDRLVCLNFHREQTTAVCHGDDLFAVALRTGLITLYYTTSCQEYMTLEHPEPVRLVEFDSQTELLASSGRRKICVWNVRNGDLVHSFALAQPLISLAFEGGVLLAPTTACHISAWSMGDGRVLPSRRWFDSADEENGEPAYPPCAVSISLGHKMMAVAYRGRPITLWDLEEDSFYRVCGKGSTGGVTGPYFANDLVFNPNEGIPRLVVAYADGDIMLLEPFRDETLACFRANTHTLAASPDGRLVVGADGFGTIQVYDFETLRVIYRINSVSCSIKRLAFSRDGLRFLDLRASECNVWEPTVLLEDSGADTASHATPTSVSVEETVAIGYSVVITTMVIHPGGEFTICGKEDGSVTLYDMKTGTEVRTLYRPKSQCLTRLLAWWDDGEVLVCVDASNKVTAWRLSKHPSSGWDIDEILFQTRVDCAKAIIQLHVNQASGKFVLSTRDTDHLWSIDGQTEEGRINSIGHCLRTWIDHPQSSDHLICMDGPVVRVFAWEDWSETTSFSLQATQGFSRPELYVKRVFPCFKGRKLLVEFSEQEGYQDTRDVAVVDSSLFRLPNGSPSPKPPGPSASSIDAELVEKVVHIIGVSDDRFIFVDIHSWVCSAELEKPGATYLRHFFVPYDWFSKMRGIICGIVELAIEKDIVFARHNGVTIVRNAFEFSERVGSVAEESDFTMARRL